MAWEYYYDITLGYSYTVYHLDTHLKDELKEGIELELKECYSDL